jgi:hypothetical protein
LDFNSETCLLKRDKDTFNRREVVAIAFSRLVNAADNKRMTLSNVREAGFYRPKPLMPKPFLEGETTMGEAKRRKVLDPSFGAFKSPTLHPIYHYGIDRAVETLSSMIQLGQMGQMGRGRQNILLTNDIPGHPDEVSMGFTATQIEELRRWVEQNPDRIPPNTQIKVLPMENCIHKGRIWKSNDFTKLLIDL